MMEGKIFGNRYELIERVGTGGMALVYKAKDKMLNRFVAVKVLRDEFKENEEFIRRFNVESQAAAILSHQNIVQIYDVGEEEGVHYIVMEYLEGTTLKKYISEKGGKLSWREAANFSMQICRALDHAHSKHVVHRDIKPQNIMIIEGGKLKVADFGIARAANNSTTVQLSTKNAVGSAHYLSPEQARGGYTDHRSDIYSLGIVMYEMFTGRLPFDADNGVSVIMQHIHEEAQSPYSVNPDLPLGIDAIITKAIKKEQRLRYDNAADILEDLISVYQNPSVKPSVLRASEENGSQPQVEQKKLRDKRRHTEEKRQEKRKKRRKNVAITIGVSAVLISLIACLFVMAYNILTNTGEEILIPDLIGMTYEEAAREAANVSTEDVVFDVVVERSDYSEEKKDTIISQMPEGNSAVKRSREIKVVLSLGPVAVTLEDYTGKDFEKIEKMLEEKGIKVIMEEDGEATESDGTIVRQVPDAGTELGEGEEITLYVSVGEKNTVVPNVIGKTLDEAIVLIERNNLEVGEVKEAPSDEFGKGHIFRQSKGAYETVPEKTVINLYVSNGEKENTDGGKENTDEGTLSGEKLKKKKVTLSLSNLPAGREKVNIRLVLDGQTFYEGDFPTEKGTADISFETTKTLSLDVYYDGVYITTKEVKY